MGIGTGTQPSFLTRLFVHPFYVWPTAGALGGFYEQFAALLRAGLPVLRVFDALADQCNSGVIRRRLPAMKQHIENQGDLAGAFALFPHLFPPVHVAMIQAGEYGGRVDAVFELLARMCKQRARLIGKFITGVLYPVVLLHFALLALPFIDTLQGAERPYWSVALPGLLKLWGVLLVLLVAPRMMRQFAGSALALDVFQMLIPFYATVVQKLALARLARSFDGLYSAGMAFDQALPIAADTCGNELVRRRVRRVIPLVGQGRPISEAMRTVGGFPAAFVNMLATGEEGGELSQMLRNTAEYYETDAEAALTRLATVLPVLIYIGVAVYIGYQIVRTVSDMMAGRTAEINKALGR